MRTIDLSQRIPIHKIEKGFLVSKAQSISVVFALNKPEVYSLSEGQLEEQYDLFNRVIKALPKGYIFHLQDYYNTDFYERDQESTSFLSSAYERVFQGRPFLSHRAYLIITKAPTANRFVSNLMTSLVTGRLVKREILDGLPEFNNTIRKVEHILSTGGIGVQQLGSPEVVTLLNEYYNLGNQRILKDIFFEKDHIKIGPDDLVIYNTEPVGKGFIS